MRNMFWSLHLFFKVRLGSFLENHVFFESKRVPQWSQESFGGSIASRPLICVGKQRVWYSAITPFYGGDGGDGDDGGRIF